MSAENSPGTASISLENKPTLIRNYTVEYYHTDLNSRIKLSSMFNFMQDIAGIHANELGCGFDVLSKAGLTWIMLRAKITMETYPAWGDAITIRTSTNGVDRLCAVREFEFLDTEGKLIGNAITYWILYDFKENKIVRMNHSGNMMQYRFELPEHLKRNFGDYEKLSRISGEGEQIAEFTRSAQYSDIDTNLHVNNARYIEWIADAVYSSSDGMVSESNNDDASQQSQDDNPAAASEQRLIKSLHVGFTSSVKPGDSVVIKRFDVPGNSRREILRIFKEDTEYLQAEVELI